MKKTIAALFMTCILISCATGTNAQNIEDKIMKEKVYYNQKYSDIKIAGELYKPEYVNPAVEKLVNFYGKYLKTTEEKLY